jgi:hypothetical protein
MKDTVFLAVNSYGVVRMTKRWPSLARDEVGLKLTIYVPDTAFCSPVLGITLNVPEDRTIQPDASVVVDEVPPEEADPS